MSITSVCGRRIANYIYPYNEVEYEILQTAEITAITDFNMTGKGLTYELRNLIADLKTIVGRTSNCSTNFGYRQTIAFINSNAYPDSIQRLIRGFILFKTPLAYHTVNLKEFEGVSNGAWAVANEINRQVKLYANGEMPSGDTNPFYDADNWIWLHANLIVHYKRG